MVIVLDVHWKFFGWYWLIFYGLVLHFILFFSLQYSLTDEQASSAAIAEFVSLTMNEAKEYNFLVLKSFPLLDPKKIEGMCLECLFSKIWDYFYTSLIVILAVYLDSDYCLTQIWWSDLFKLVKSFTFRAAFLRLWFFFCLSCYW